MDDPEPWKASSGVTMKVPREGTWLSAQGKGAGGSAGKAAEENDDAMGTAGVARW